MIKSSTTTEILPIEIHHWCRLFMVMTMFSWVLCIIVSRKLKRLNWFLWSRMKWVICNSNGQLLNEIAKEIAVRIDTAQECWVTSLIFFNTGRFVQDEHIFRGIYLVQMRKWKRQDFIEKDKVWGSLRVALTNLSMAGRSV